MKKNKRMSKVSLSKGMAENRATINTFRPLILEMAFRGLNTLKTLRLAGLNPVASSGAAPGDCGDSFIV
jgi:hypothetical protein